MFTYSSKNIIPLTVDHYNATVGGLFMNYVRMLFQKNFVRGVPSLKKIVLIPMVFTFHKKHFISQKTEAYLIPPYGFHPVSVVSYTDKIHIERLIV